MKIDYEQALKSIPPESKISLWSQVKDMNLSNKTKLMIVYYKARKEGLIK